MPSAGKVGKDLVQWLGRRSRVDRQTDRQTDIRLSGKTDQYSRNAGLERSRESDTNEQVNNMAAIDLTGAYISHLVRV